MCGRILLPQDKKHVAGNQQIVNVCEVSKEANEEKNSSVTRVTLGVCQVAERAGQLSDAAPIGFGSRLPSMAGMPVGAVRSAAAAAAGGHSEGFTWQTPFPSAQSASAPEPALPGGANSGGEIVKTSIEQIM